MVIDGPVCEAELDQLISAGISSGEYFRNPYPLFAQLRVTAPVFYSEVIGGWILTKHEDVDALLRDHHSYSSKGRVLFLLDQLPEPARSSVQLLREHFSHGLAHSDDPEHRRLRVLLANAFTPKMVESFRGRIREVADDYISKFSGEVDLIADLLTPLPARIVGEILGSAPSDIPDLIRWAHAINGLYEKGGKIGQEQAVKAEHLLVEMRAFVLRLVEERRAQNSQGMLLPEKDILSGLVAAEATGDQLTESELLSTMVTLFVAGHETTTHLLGNGMFALLSRPNVLAELCADPGLLPLAIEEMARFDGSVPRSWRIALDNREIGGKKITAGQMVLPLLAAANRDPEVFESPDDFRIRRNPKKHLAYGKGIHMCLGAPLARLEAAEILTSIFHHHKNFSLIGNPDDLEWRQDMALRGLITLPVNFC